MRCLIFFFSQYWKTTKISSGRQDQLQKRRHIPTLLWGSLIPDMWALWEQWADLCFYPCGWLPARPHTILASIWAVRAAQSLGSQVSALPSPFQPCEGTQRTRTCRLRFRGEDGDLPTALPTTSDAPGFRPAGCGIPTSIQPRPSDFPILATLQLTKSLSDSYNLSA